MADKIYELTFGMSDGSKQTARFTAPQGPQGETGAQGATGEQGADGGYYVPSVTQVDEYTVKMSFTPSKEGMSEAADQSIALPPGADGKSAYAYAQAGGYTGTEAEFGAKLAAEWGEFVIGVVCGEDGAGTLDKTGAEIIAALEAGRSVICAVTYYGDSDGPYRVPLYSKSVEDSTYTLIFAASMTSLFKMVQVVATNAAVTAYGMQSQADITVNGTTWSGGEAVDFTEVINGMIDAKIPETLPNPNKLIFTGAVSGEYDGSGEVTINIPSSSDEVTTETVLSDNLFDVSTAVTGKNWYHSSSGPTLVDTTNAFCAYVPLRGAGTYRTILWWTHHGSAYALRVPILKEDNTFLQNVTGTLTDIDGTFGYLEFTVTADMVANGAAVYAYGGMDAGDPYSKEDLMIVKDREYPGEYVPYGYIEVTKESADPVNVLSGKTAVFLGDSLCAGTTVGDDSEYYGYGWAGLIGEGNAMTWKNYGRNGGTITPLAAVAEERWVPTQAETASTEYPAADYVIFEGGCNDADQMGDTLLGEIASDYETFDITTFSGALESLTLQILTAWPEARVGYIVPQKMYAQNDHTAAGHVHRRFFDRAVEICEKWGVPCVDLWKGNPLNPKLSTAETFYTDGQHLTLAGYRRVTPQIEAWMRSL